MPSTDTSLAFARRASLLLPLLFLLAAPAFTQTCPPLSLDDITDPGPFTVATLTEADGLRNGPGYTGATIYYPTDATPPFASMAMVPGFISLPSSIQDWGPFLASHGIVTMIVGTNSLFADPTNRGEALLDAIVTLRAEDTRAASPLSGQLDTDKISVGGWSMGGGGAQLAAATDNSLRAVMALTPWLPPGQVGSADLDHPVPTLIFGGENDGVAPPAVHANVHYDLTPDATDKLLYEIAGGDHNIANGPAGANGSVGQFAISWLQQYLIEDDCYCSLREETPPAASLYETNVVCPANPGTLPVTLTALWLSGDKDGNRISFTLVGTDLDRVELHGGYDHFATRLLGEITGAEELDETFEHAPADLGRWHYYRLRFVDFDGTSEWSDWLTAAPRDKGARAQVQYDRSGRAWLRVGEGGPTEAIVFDANGRQVTVPALVVGRNRLPELRRGIYTVRFADSEVVLRYLVWQ